MHIYIHIYMCRFSLINKHLKIYAIAYMQINRPEEDL